MLSQRIVIQPTRCRSQHFQQPRPSRDLRSHGLMILTSRDLRDGDPVNFLEHRKTTQRRERRRGFGGRDEGPLVGGFRRAGSTAEEERIRIRFCTESQGQGLSSLTFLSRETRNRDSRVGYIPSLATRPSDLSRTIPWQTTTRVSAPRDFFRPFFRPAC